MMNTNLYLDLLSPEERVNQGQPIKKPPVAGLLPIERTKVSQLRHANEGDLLRKVQAGLKGKKYVSFKVDPKKQQPSQKGGKGKGGA
jgi:hypothetical protein